MPGSSDMSVGTEFLTVHVRVADIVKRRQVDVVNVNDVIAEMPGEVRRERKTPFDAGEPEHVALPFAEVEAAKLIAAAQGKEQPLARQARRSTHSKGETGVVKPANHRAIAKRVKDFRHPLDQGHLAVQFVERTAVAEDRQTIDRKSTRLN